jgi:hypothetical protein
MEREHHDATVRTTQVLLNHSTDQTFSDSEDIARHRTTDDTGRSGSELPAEEIVALAMTQRRATTKKTSQQLRHGLAKGFG